MDHGVRAFIRFMERYGINESTRRLLTIAIVVTDDDRLWKLVGTEGPSGVLQEDLVEEILRTGKPRDVASLLWSRIGLHMSADLFARVFRSLLLMPLDLVLVHKLIGAAVDFLRSHPGTVGIPRDLADRLLDSSDCEHRIIGLKALCRHCDADAQELVTPILSALKSDNWYEMCGGLAELAGMLEHNRRRGTNLTDASLVELGETVARIVTGQLGEDAGDLRATAQRCAEILAEMRGSKRG